MDATEPKHAVVLPEPDALEGAEPRPHPLQRLMDNPWLLLALGLVVPFVSYTLWGWIELNGISEARLP